MPRIRSIKPEFFASLDVARLPIRARLTWIGLWTYVDDEGRGIDDARLIKAAVWPLDDDVTPDAVNDDLTALAEVGHVVRYAVEGRRLLVVPTFTEHQHPNRPTPSKHPAPPPHEHSESTHGALIEDSSPEGRGGERRGGGRSSTAVAIVDSRPSPFCPKHPNGTEHPCRACGDARRRSGEWKPPLARAPDVVREPDCPRHPDYPHPDSRHGCPRCADEAAAKATA